MLIKDLFNYGKNVLNENNIDDSSIIANILIQYILNMDKTEIIINEKKEVEEQDRVRYYLSLIKIIEGMPVQYIINKQEFYGIDFYVNENVLIPQPDTEILVEEVLELAKNMQDNIKILDICTGSGCIGITLLNKIKNAEVDMSDISKEALEVAKINLENNHKNKEKVKLIESNMFENIKDKYDIIVSNPPYIETKEIKKLDKQVQKEPLIALDGGEDGLNFYKILISESNKYLNKNGYLCMEIGFDQKEIVVKLLEESKQYKNIYYKKDLSGNDRIVIAQK